MGPAMGPKFGKDAAYVTLDRFFRDQQLVSDQLVGISSCNQGQDFDLPFTQSVICSMASEFCGDFRVNELFTGTNSSDRVKQICPRVTF